MLRDMPFDDKQGVYYRDNNGVCEYYCPKCKNEKKNLCRLKEEQFGYVCTTCYIPYRTSTQEAAYVQYQNNGHQADSANLFSNARKY
jgi:hypothetical protein